ncbi:TetR/AcrR family transcriptional regulator [Streptomyces purpureus]|uniref:TetR family transcriptional regulator n=1 Tax=Streptomyces purpureus TaxID=1951 RepID=A0A918LMM8_9ACTN|nr:TetR/AcrR family transcriptional regulator [Streptomyces purpureus]GGT21969.1 TetR family transcriptional regulator [Streptomyces purpureus]
MVSAAEGTKRPARSSVWLDGKAARGRRADQPSGLDRDRITAAAVRLLDADGLGKFSMRRLAAELNVTAMSVYWYVDTKDDLLELALDAVIGEVELPDVSDVADWRGQLRELAGGYREMLVRHPWASHLTGTYLNIGPNAVAFAARGHAVMANTDLPPYGQMGGLAAVFQFVYGFGTIEGQFLQRCVSAGVSQDDYYREAVQVMTEQPRFAENFPNAVGLLAERSGESVAAMRERDFTFALDLIIKGIEAMAARPE